MWTPCKTKKERQAKVKQLLLEKDKAVIRAVLAIYRRQTYDEQATQATKETNYQGFCAHDASTMSMYAQQILQYGGLTVGQIKIARTRMVRYSRQLAEIAEMNERLRHENA